MSKQHRRTPDERIASRLQRSDRGRADRRLKNIAHRASQFHTWIEPQFIGYTVTLITIPHDGTRMESRIGWRLTHRGAQKLAHRIRKAAILLSAATVDGDQP